MRHRSSRSASSGGTISGNRERAYKSIADFSNCAEAGSYHVRLRQDMVGPGASDYVFASVWRIPAVQSTVGVSGIRCRSSAQALVCCPGKQFSRVGYDLSSEATEPCATRLLIDKHSAALLDYYWCIRFLIVCAYSNGIIVRSEVDLDGRL